MKVGNSASEAPEDEGCKGDGRVRLGMVEEDKGCKGDGGLGLQR